jgi:hypothetical protein
MIGDILLCSSSNQRGLFYVLCFAGMVLAMLASILPLAVAQGGLQLAISNVVPQMQTTYRHENPLVNVQSGCSVTIL